MADWGLARYERKEFGTAQVARGSANSKGAYVELIAAASFAYQALTVSAFGGNGGGQCFLIDIAIGPAGAEQVVLPNLLLDTMRGVNSNQLYHTFPVSVPAGARISARLQETGGSGTRTLEVSVNGRGGGFNYPLPPAGLAENYGANAATSNAVLVDQGAVANIYGAWTEITPATARQHNQLAAILGMNQSTSSMGSGTWGIQIGIGPAGSEIVIDEIAAAMNTNVNRIMQTSFDTFANIPAGTRLSMRSKCNNVTAAARNLTAMILGI